MRASVEAGESPDLAALRERFERPDGESAPMVRWWWFGPDVERHEICRELDRIAEGGYGGVELSVVYPLSTTTGRFMSEKFLGDVNFAVGEARARRLRFDVTLGSGWSFGGPHIGPGTAARRMHWERHEIGEASMRVAATGMWPHDELLAAYVGDGSLQELPESFSRLDVIDGEVRVPSGRGPRVVLIGISRLTGQNVKRAASGAEGPVLDHYSAEATDAHIAAVCDPLLDAVPAEHLGSAFCDSLEVYGADWTRSLPEQFRSRRGYDPMPSLWLLHSSSADGEEFRADFYSTLTELYEENFVARLQAWAARRGVEFRIQSYGVPPASVSSYRYADRFEGEGWGWTELTQTRWASSAAQLYGRSVVSSEIWTWVHSPSLRATPLDLKGEFHEHVLLGINHFIGHGWPYSPRDGNGTGWLFYASGALDDRNPWWPVTASLTRYMHRLSWILRQGQRVSDVGLYAPTRDVYARMSTERAESLNLWAGVRDHVGVDVPKALRTAGYDFDLFDDDALEVLDPARYPVIVLPYVTRLPQGAADWLQRVEAAGGRVLRIGGTVDVGVEVDDLADALRGEMAPPLGIRGCDGSTPETVGTVYRRVGDTDIYFVANTGPRRETLAIEMRTPRAVVERWDAETGARIEACSGLSRIEVSLEAYEAALFVAFDAQPGVPESGTRVSPSVRELRLDGPWQVRFPDDDNDRAVSVPHRWEDAPERANYSGAAVYSTTVDLPDEVMSCTIDLGQTEPIGSGESAREGVRGRSFRAAVAPPVGVAAEVEVNDQKAGVIWHAPYRLEVGELLRRGENSIRLTVFNTGANALSSDPTVPATNEESRRRFGRRFRMQDLEQARIGLASGLLRVPVLRLT